MRRRLTGGSNLGAVGPGVSTNYGVQTTRAVQVGFEAELTGPWSSTTGYPWKRKALALLPTPPGFVDTTIPMVGMNAVASNQDTTLQAGDYGWMEPSPDASGWIFIWAGRPGGTTSSSNPTTTVTTIPGTCVQSSNINECVIYGTCNGLIYTYVNGVLTLLNNSGLNEIIYQCGASLSIVFIPPDAGSTICNTPICLFGPVTLPSTATVTFSGGTGVFAGLTGSTTVTLDSDGSGYDINYTINGITISGELVFCCDSDPIGWYLQGLISSSATSTAYPCGCSAEFGGCPAGTDPNQTITGTVTASPGETLSLNSGCGAVTITMSGPPANSCPCTIANGTSVSIVVAGTSPNAGTYTGTWNSGSVTFSMPGGCSLTMACSRDGAGHPIYTLGGTVLGIKGPVLAEFTAASTNCGPPVSVVFTPDSGHPGGITSITFTS